MIEVSRTATVDADAAIVWGVLADFGAIGRWAPNVDHSCLLTEVQDADDLTGATRRIQTGRTVLVERITAWAPPELLAYRIEGLPPVLRAVTNEWQVAPVAGRPDRTAVTLTSRVDAGPRRPQQLIARLAAKRLAGASEEMLQGLQHSAKEIHA